MSQVQGERDEIEAEQLKHGQSYWAIVRAQFRKNLAGMAGFYGILLIVVVAALAPLLANDRPIVTSYKGDVHFPAFSTYVDNWVPWRTIRNEVKSWELGDGYFPFSDHYPELEGKTWKQAFPETTAEATDDWAVWPPVRFNPTQFDTEAIKKRPSLESSHWLGTDDQGRDVLARIIHGCVVAVTVGVIAMTIATFIGVTLGLLAAYFGGWVDIVLARVVEIFMTIPTFFLIIAVISFLPPSIINIMLVLGLFGWTTIFRLIRGEVLKVRDQDYVIAANALGVPPRRTMLLHILPNAVSPIFVTVAFGIAGAVLYETSLSFLGFGDPNSPSWGEIVSQGRQYVAEGLTHLVIAPGIAIFITLTSFNLFGQGLRDAMDPRLRR